MKTRLGKLEAQLLAYAQLRELAAVGTGDIAAALGISGKQERELYSRASRAGLIARVRRGLYLVPPRMPLGGAWSPGEAQAVNALLADRGGRYQICGPSAFNRYGFDNQVPARTYLYNNRISGEREIGAVALTLIRVADARLGATETAPAPDGQSALYSSRARTLIDAIYDWARFGGLPRAYGWIQLELRQGRVTADELARIAVRYGNQATLRRIGALLEKEGAAEPVLRRMARALRPIGNLIAFDPTAPRRGHSNQRWGVVCNDD